MSIIIEPKLSNVYQSHGQLVTATATHPGLIRQLNEDNVLALVRDNSDQGEAAALLIVADGMGGHQAGEIASQIAVNTIRDAMSWLIDIPKVDKKGNVTGNVPPMLSVHDLAELDDDSDRYPPLSYLERYLRAAVWQANSTIHKYAQSHPNDAGNLGTTVTCLLIVGDEAIVANVGDSRTYHLRNGAMRLITQDHSYVAQLIRLGRLKPEALFTHPQRNLITRSLGRENQVDVDVWTTDVKPGDKFLLCSDGLWEMVQDQAEIVRQLNFSDPQAATERLVELALHYGGHDNISVAVAENKVS